MSDQSLPACSYRNSTPFSYLNERGFSLIEVLVTLVVVALGLLGLAALQAKMQLSEIDAYQRAQALLLVQDMSDRIAANRRNATSYVTASGETVGTGDSQPSDCTTLTDPTLQETDICQWSSALKGAAEGEVTTEGTTLTGAMIGAQGCIEALPSDPDTETYLVYVVWQGLTPLSAPSAGLPCGSGEYNGFSDPDNDGVNDSPCQSDNCRRALSTIVRIGALDGTGP